MEGWYIGLAGSPFGPTSVTVIREKLNAGEVHADSLVWRDGQGEWQPLRTFPEMLGANVNAGNSVNVNSDNDVNAPRAPLASSASAATPAPSPYLAPPEPAPGAAELPAPELPSPPPPSATPAPYVSAFSSPMGRGSAATAVLTDIFPDRAGNPFAAPDLPPSSAPHGSSPGGSPILAALPDPFGPPAAPPVDVAPAPLSLSTAAPTKAPSTPDGSAGGFTSGPGGTPVEIDESVVPRQRRPLHPMAYAFIAFAAVFGGVAAYVLLSKPQQIIVVQAAPSANVGALDPKVDKTQAPVEAEVAAGGPTTDATGAPIVRTGPIAGGGGPRPKSSAAASPIDTSGFTSTIPGPSTAQVPPPSGAGGQLSAGEIQGVVAQNQAIVKRKCWQPALESRAASAPTNARVNGSITIGASGNVESATASGGERDFPGLSSCIASRMKGWKFPPSSSSTPVNVPFVFAGQ
jgi:GYF domain 2